jgi:hypothetical protein
MEPTSSPDNARQSRGLARFWPVHGMPAPAQRHSDEDSEGMDSEQEHQDQQVSGPPAVSHSASAQAAAAAQLAASTAGDNALTSETQMVALGSRRGFDVSNGARAWTGNQSGFPPVESERDPRNGDQAPRHGGGPVPNGAPVARPPFAVPAAAATPPSLAEQQAPRPPVGSGAPTSGAPSPFQPASPFAPPAPAPRPSDENVRGIPLGAAAAPGGGDGQRPASGEPPRGAASVPASGRRRSTDEDVDTDEQDETGDDAQLAAEPPNRPTGWASVPTSGVPTISGSASVTGNPLPRPADDRPGVGLPAGSFPAESNGTNGRAAMPAAGPATGSGPDNGTGLAAASTGLSGTGLAGANGRSGAAAPAESQAVPVDGPGLGEQLEAQQGGPRRLASLADADAVQPRSARRPAADPAPAGGAPAGDTPLRPGDVNLSQITFWDEEAITHFRSEWHEVKAGFVDDPVAALTRAHDLLTDAVNELSEAMLAERDELDPLRNTSTPDTESMRMAMRGYREFLDRILAL